MGRAARIRLKLPPQFANRNAQISHSTPPIATPDSRQDFRMGYDLPCIFDEDAEHFIGLRGNVNFLPLRPYTVVR